MLEAVVATHPEQLLDEAAAALQRAWAGLPPDDLRPIPLLAPDAQRGERLRLALAERLGALAGVELLLPAEFLWRWLPARLGLPAPLFDLAVARWRLGAALEGLPLIGPAPGAAWDARRVGLAERCLAALLRLAQWDASSVEAWERGDPSPHDDAHPYLAPLWRALAGRDDPRRALQRLAAAVPQAHDLPPLVLVVGALGLAPPVVELLAALGRRTRCLLLLWQPLAGAWEDLAGPAAPADAAAPARRLLAHWGRAARQALQRLDAAGAEVHALPPPAAAEPSTLLARLQAALAGGEPPAGGRDGSFAVQRAWSRRAEVEALKHRLVGWLAARPEIPPHRIAIACPEPAEYAPLLAAVCAAPGEGPALPLDAPGSGEGPDLQAARLLLEWLPGRWEASAVCAALAHPAIAEGWGIDAGLLERLRRWCAAADLRFGADAAHRAALGQPAEAAATWRRGLQRLAWGAAAGADIAGIAIRDGALPVAGLDDEELPELARLCALLLPLLDAAAAWRQPHDAAWWQRELRRLVRHARQRDDDAGLAQALAAWRQALAAAGSEGSMFSADAVAAALPAPGGIAHARGGIVLGRIGELAGGSWDILGLVGFDSGRFPPAAVSDVDPLLAAPPAGLALPRDEARAALLELLAGVRHHLLISWVGRDPHEGAALPPCAPIADLIAAAAALAACPPEALIDDLALAGARALPPGPWPSAAIRDACREAAVAAAPLRPAEPPPAPPGGAPDLAALARALRDPPRLYLEALGVRPLDEDEPPADHERLVLADGLERWELRDGLLQALLDGRSVEEELARLAASGRLPPGAWGRAQAAEALAFVRALREGPQRALWAAAQPAAEPVMVDLEGTVVRGVFDRVHPEHGPLHITASHRSARDQQRLWLAGLLWRAAGHPGSGVLLAYDDGELKPRYAPSLSPEEARAALAALVAWYGRARRRPCPLYPELVEAIAGADPSQVVAKARNAWRSSWSSRAPAKRPAARWLWPEDDEPDWTDPALPSDAAVLGGGRWVVKGDGRRRRSRADD